MHFPINILKLFLIHLMQDLTMSTTTYPDTNLADQLKTVARLMRGGIQSKIFMVKLGGFDTHNNQNQASGDIQGKHL